MMMAALLILIIVLCTLMSMLTLRGLPTGEPSPTPDPADEPTDKMPAIPSDPVERARYFKGRTDIPVDTGDYYSDTDSDNMAAMVRAAFLTGNMVIGNVNEDGDLEMSIHNPKGGDQES